MIPKKSLFLAFFTLFLLSTPRGQAADLFTPISDPRRKMTGYKDIFSRFFWKSVFKQKETIKIISKEALEGYDITQHFSYGVPAGVKNTTLDEVVAKTRCSFSPRAERAIECISALTVPALFCALGVGVSYLAQFINKKKAQIQEEHEKQLAEESDDNENPDKAKQALLEQDTSPLSLKLRRDASAQAAQAVKDKAEDTSKNKPFDQVVFDQVQDVISDYAFFALIYGCTRICFKNFVAQEPIISPITVLLSLGGIGYLVATVERKHLWNTYLGYFKTIRDKIDQLWEKCIPNEYSNNFIMNNMRYSLKAFACYYAGRLWLTFTKDQYHTLTRHVEKTLTSLYGHYVPRDAHAQATYTTVAKFVKQYEDDVAHKKLTPCTAQSTWYQLGHQWCTCRNNAITLLSYVERTNTENPTHNKHNYTIVKNGHAHHECHVCKQKPSSLLATKDTPCSHYTCAFCIVGKRSFCDDTHCIDTPVNTQEDLKNTVMDGIKLLHGFAKHYT